MSTETQDTIANRPFFGQQGFSKTYNPQKEAPHHREICIRLARGDRPFQIADEMGVSSCMIQYVRAQPWAQEFIALLQAEQGRQAVQEVLQGATLEAAKLIAESIKLGHRMLDGQKPVDGHKLADSTKDAHKLLDRVFGTAVQTVQHVDAESMQQMSTEELLAIVNGQRVAQTN